MSILLHLLAAAAYLGLAAHFWRTRWQGPALDQPSVGLCYWERGVLLATLTAHGIALAQDIFTDGSMRFGFAVSLSMMFWLAIALFFLGMSGLGVTIWPNVVPPSITIWDAAAPERSQEFMLVGVALTLPLIIAYTVWAYWVFRGKVGAEGYH